MLDLSEDQRSFLQGGGELGELIRAKDWSTTPLGAVETWPQSLRTTLGILLNSRYPMFVFWGPQLVKIYNDGYRPITGHKHPWALGRPAPEVWPEIWADINPLVDRAMSGEPTWSDDLLLFMERNGFPEEVYFTFSYSPVPDESGGIGGMFCACTETTRKVLGERRLQTLRDLAAGPSEARTAVDACRRSAEVLRQCAADVPFAAIYLMGEDGAASLAASTALPAGSPLAPDTIRPDDTTGWPVHAVMASRTPVDVAPLPGPATAVPAGPWPERPSSAMVLPLVDRGRDGAAGALVLGLSSRRPFDDEYSGWCVLIAGQVSANLSNARAHENEKRRAEALAEIDRAKTAFFSNVSHEFRTPLTLMIGPIEDALTSPAGALTGDALDTVHRNALRLLKLVNTLLDFTRLEAGRVAARFELVDLPQLTADLASSFRAAIEQAGLELHVVCPSLAEPVPVDRGMWEKIVLNLLSNALKFTLRGSITVALALDGDEVALRVTDTGVGIAPDQRDRVFDRFHRIEGTAARTQEGSGIGLALVRELVTLHRGTVEVTSTPGAGSTFIVRLPARQTEMTAALASAVAVPAVVARPYVEEAVGWAPVRPTAPMAAGASARPARHAERGPRLLIADDNADMRQYLARLFADRFDIEVVADGEAALEAARRQTPDVIVSDVMMPRLDGLGLVAAVRAEAALRNVPILLLSARAGEEARVDGLHAGADDYLVKPFSARELIARVDTQLMRARVRWLEQQQAEAASRAKDEFLAMLGHELRNPLAPILTALQILRLRGVTGAEREHQVIERQVQHLVSLVDDLLDVSRIARGKVQLKHERLDLADVVAKAIEMTSPAIEAGRHRLTVQVPRGLLVEGDAARLAQVIANLLVNAAKYSDPGGAMTIEAERRDASAVVRVADRGHGIAAEMLPHVFDLFSQERQELDRSAGGLGLGLAIVRSLVQAHGGTVTADSRGKGHGAVFTVTLPLSTGSVAAVAAAPGRTAPVVTPGLRILVVDDNPDAAEMLVTALESLGHATRHAFDGPAALDVASEFGPQVALLDLGLPVMDGYELAERLAASGGADLEMVAVTGYGQQADRERTRRAGFAGHLVKPIDLEQLEAWLRASQARRSA